MRQGMKASFLFLKWDRLNLPTSHPISAPYVRFYEPQGGGIYLDGCPASAFSLGEWSRAVAMVGQEPVLFSGTIGDNIAYGKWGKATQEVRAGRERGGRGAEGCPLLPLCPGI